jgi:HPr kinase/phosphorylase
MSLLSERPATPVPPVTVGDFLADPQVAAGMRLVAGALGEGRVLDHPRIQKSGLVLAGHVHGIVPTRVQILGETEISYLETLDPPIRRARLELFLGLGLSLVVVTRGETPPAELIELADATGTPVALGAPRSSRCIQIIHTVLDRLLAPTMQMHGVLIDIHGIGTLLVGKSGIGKSECALFLLERGHRLVADDQVVLTRLPPDQLRGEAPALLKGHLELRGVGILDVRDLFGAPAVREKKLVQLVVELCPESEIEDFDRLGLEDRLIEILGVPVPLLRIPVRPGRNMAVILEVAARNHLLKRSGRNAARSFVQNLEARLGAGPSPDEAGDDE